MHFPGGCKTVLREEHQVHSELTSGQWAEFTEWVVAIQSTHNSFTETSFYKWWRYWKTGKFLRL